MSISVNIFDECQPVSVRAKGSRVKHDYPAILSYMSSEGVHRAELARLNAQDPGSATTGHGFTTLFPVAGGKVDSYRCIVTEASGRYIVPNGMVMGFALSGTSYVFSCDAYAGEGVPMYTVHELNEDGSARLSRTAHSVGAAITAISNENKATGSPGVVKSRYGCVVNDSKLQDAIVRLIGRELGVDGAAAVFERLIERFPEPQGAYTSKRHRVSTAPVTPAVTNAPADSDTDDDTPVYMGVSSSRLANSSSPASAAAAPSGYYTPTAANATLSRLSVLQRTHGPTRSDVIAAPPSAPPDSASATGSMPPLNSATELASALIAKGIAHGDALAWVTILSMTPQVVQSRTYLQHLRDPEQFTIANRTLCENITQSPHADMAKYNEAVWHYTRGRYASAATALDLADVATIENMDHRVAMLRARCNIASGFAHTALFSLPQVLRRFSPTAYTAFVHGTPARLSGAFSAEAIEAMSVVAQAYSANMFALGAGIERMSQHRSDHANAACRAFKLATSMRANVPTADSIVDDAFDHIGWCMVLTMFEGTYDVVGSMIASVSGVLESAHMEDESLLIANLLRARMDTLYAFRDASNVSSGEYMTGALSAAIDHMTRATDELNRIYGRGHPEYAIAIRYLAQFQHMGGRGVYKHGANPSGKNKTTAAKIWNDAGLAEPTWLAYLPLHCQQKLPQSDLLPSSMP